jgi:hypothetical protein
MKLDILLSASVTLVLSSSAPANDYSSLADQGYRWVSVNGPYACHTEPGAEQLTKRQADPEIRTSSKISGVITCYQERSFS